MGDDFRPLGGFAVVRLDRLKARGDQPAQDRNWALLHADGQVLPMPSSLREPLSDADGWLLPESQDTPWIPFIDHQGHVVWVDGMFGEQARVTMSEGAASLHTAAGEVWSGRHEALGPVKPFFSPHPEQVLVDVNSVAGVLSLAEQLCAQVESRLHRAAAGEALDPVRDHPDADEMDDEDDDDWSDDGEHDDEDAALADLDWRTARTEARQTARLVRAERRLSRHYLDESHGGHYHFLYGEWGDLSHALHEQFRQILTERFGPPDVLPDWAGWQESHKPWLGWTIAVKEPLPGDDGSLPEYRQLWICLQQSGDTGDGDGWDENWLLVAPSADALALAMRARADQPGVPSAPDEAAAVRLVTTHPHALQALPREHLSDAAIDAALDADIDVVKQVPKRLMNHERYTRAVRARRLEIGQVPLEVLDEAICMAHLGDSSTRLGEIPEPWRTEAVCLEALRQSPYALEYVPEAIKQALLARGVVLQEPWKKKVNPQPTDPVQGVAASMAALLTEDPQKPLKNLKHSLSLGAWVLRLAFSGKTTQPVENRGIAGWLERRPFVAAISNNLLSTLAIVCHALVTIEAWALEGWMIALATGVLFGASELYWAWRAFFGDLDRPGLGLTALVPLLYLLVWIPLHRRVAKSGVRRLSGSGPGESP